MDTQLKLDTARSSYEHFLQVKPSLEVRWMIVWNIVNILGLLHLSFRRRLLHWSFRRRLLHWCFRRRRRGCVVQNSSWRRCSVHCWIRLASVIVNLTPYKCTPITCTNSGTEITEFNEQNIINIHLYVICMRLTELKNSFGYKYSKWPLTSGPHHNPISVLTHNRYTVKWVISCM